jgi:uncharacterized protein (DUF1499 family)
MRFPAFSTFYALPIISIDNEPVQPTMQSQPAPASNQPNYVNTQDTAQEADVFGAIEKLAGLKDKGILTDAECSTKKSELLARL